jgi:hypothetical protein
MLGGPKRKVKGPRRRHGLSRRDRTGSVIALVIVNRIAPVVLLTVMLSSVALAGWSNRCVTCCSSSLRAHDHDRDRAPPLDTQLQRACCCKVEPARTTAKGFVAAVAPPEAALPARPTAVTIAVARLVAPTPNPTVARPRSRGDPLFVRHCALLL